jgi:choline-glycine betaine transporter
MTLWLSIGIIFSLFAIFCVLLRWGGVVCIGVTPVKTLSFIAILFTSGLDVGLIMFPLTEFPVYTDIIKNPEYAFSNPMAIEFGFWGFLVWSMYFLTCFYFCVIEPKVKYFDIFLVKIINNIVIIGTCAFTASLFLSNLPWYLPDIEVKENASVYFYSLVAFAIIVAVYSSSNLRYLKTLSVGSTLLFFLLIASMALMLFIFEEKGFLVYLQSLGLVGNYFANIEQFILPINAYHEFYLYWWFAWSIMIGQFTSRFVGGLKTWQLLLAMMIIPSILIALWFAVLYSNYRLNVEVSGLISFCMIFVGIAFVINSLDSLIRLYTDNLGLEVKHLGLVAYFFINVSLMAGLTLLFQMEFIKIQWVGALVVALFLSCFLYIVRYKFSEVAAINASPKENKLDFDKILLAH